MNTPEQVNTPEQEDDLTQAAQELRDELAAAVDQAAVSGLPYDRIAAIYDAARYRYIEGEL